MKLLPGRVCFSDKRAQVVPIKIQIILIFWQPKFGRMITEAELKTRPSKGFFFPSRQRWKQQNQAGSSWVVDYKLSLLFFVRPSA